MKKSILKYLVALLIGLVTFGACNKDDDDPVIIIPPDEGGETVDLANGYYVYSGDITALADIPANGLMLTTNNENGQVERASLVETFQLIDAANGFYVIEVTNGSVDYIGSSDAAKVDPLAEEPIIRLYKGSTSDDSVAYSVDTSAVYHITYDSELEYIVYSVVDWGLIGAATPDGWGANTPIPFKEADATKIVWEGTGIEMTSGGYKLRYSDGWKIFFGDNIDTDVRVNTNLGGTLDALSPGGSDMNWDVADAGIYTFALTYTFGTGYTIEATKTGDVNIPTYPEALYIAGDASAYGWPTVGPGEDAEAAMHKVAGGTPVEGIFWKICHLEAGNGFKISAESWGDPNVGFADVDEFDANGVTVTENGGNLSVATSGMYMIVINLRDDMVKLSVVAPEVYGIGDAFGGYDDEDAAINLFTVDDVAKTITSPATAEATSHRMYVSHEWIPSWWNAEFVVNTTGDIEYRNDSGDDPAAYPVTAGQIITLSFDTNTGTIQ